MIDRRGFVLSVVGTVVCIEAANAQNAGSADSVHSAAPAALATAVQSFTQGAPVREGKVAIDVAALVENGNTVPITVQVDSPMTVAEHVRRVAIVTERNPQPDVVVFHLGPHNAKASVATRMRLATSQRVLALAELSDGSYWQHSVAVVVTLAACIEGV
jgi:sulfur-oxidizing protein SoxY